ncbi:MAG: hypothetical protein V1647_06745 [Pseudomonadota bacterium]
MPKVRSVLYMLASVTTVGLLSVIILFLNSDYSILGINDFKDAIMSYESPAITIPDKGESYYNKWKCFDTKNVKIYEAEIDYDGWRPIPHVDAHSNTHSFYFDLDPVIYRWNTNAVLKSWSALMNNQKHVCFFAAYLQTDPDGTQAWYIRKIKTTAGYWDEFEPAQDEINP